MGVGRGSGRRDCLMGVGGGRTSGRGNEERRRDCLDRGGLRRAEEGGTGVGPTNVNVKTKPTGRSNTVGPADNEPKGRRVRV